MSSYKVCSFTKIKISMQYTILKSTIGSADFYPLVVSFTYKRVCHEFFSFLPRSVVITMSLRQICKETARRPLKALTFFTGENKTGIAPSRLVVQKGIELREGMKVRVNREGKKVSAEILALNGKLLIH